MVTMKVLHHITLIAICICVAIQSSSGQAGTGMKIGDAHQEYIDSLQRAGYPGAFPVGRQSGKERF